MNTIYISKKSNKILQDYLSNKGYNLQLVESDGIVSDGLSCHPDIFLCKMGLYNNSPVYFAEKGILSEKYPDDIRFNAACTGKYFIHNLSYTDEKLLLAAKAMDMQLVNVRQGYSKCSIVVVDENSIITYDEGIVKSCRRFPDLEVLKVEKGHVKLEGYDTGFIGGASGRVGNEIIFNGDLSKHPDFESIVDFIENKGLKCKWFPEFELTDIGSII